VQLGSKILDVFYTGGSEWGSIELLRFQMGLMFEEKIAIKFIKQVH
jgi:hypothetical protein